jgi:hypothetical protein
VGIMTGDADVVPQPWCKDSWRMGGPDQARDLLRRSGLGGTLSVDPQSRQP